MSLGASPALGALPRSSFPNGHVSVHSVAFLPYMESVFEEVFKLLEVRGLVDGVGGVQGLEGPGWP